VAPLIGAVPAATGGNLLLVEPFDRFPLEGTWSRAGLSYASRSQIIADLLGSPPPAPDQAAALLAATPT
jgi:hypothetical protein